MDLERLVSALEPLEVLGRHSVEVRDLAYDARAVTPGALFFAFQGERADGHDFAPEAVERGAVALVVEQALDVPVPQVVVRDARAAMAKGYAAAGQLLNERKARETLERLQRAQISA